MKWSNSSGAHSERVVVYAPFGRDGRIIGEVMQQAGIDSFICTGLDSLLAELPKGAGAVLIGDEALGPDEVRVLSGILEQQPKWSDLPVLVLTSGGEATWASQARLRILDPLGNVTLLERPLRRVTLLSAVQTALRTRRRQYEISNYMQEREHLLTQVRDRERVYRGIGESIDFGIWVSGRDGRNIYASDSLLELLGMTQEEYSGEGWSKALHPDESARTVAAWKECVQHGQSWNMVHQYRGIDGKWHPILARGVPIRSDTGEVLYWAGINLDISSEKAAESALKASNESLRRSNADLEQFAYAASHDLQEPLRNVIIYSQLLAESSAGKLNGQERDFLSTIVGSASRMDMLIKGLLAYTRATTVEEEIQAPVDSGQVLKKVLNDINGAAYDMRAQITFDQLPSVAVHEVHLQQLFQNLIGNAIKYRGPDPPRIHVSAERDSDWLFSVEDNGIGIDRKYWKQIFGIFKRLHSASEYPGTGIGLAVCQKIVERYGGRIWVQSEPGKGATFKFTLPAQ